MIIMNKKLSVQNLYKLYIKHHKSAAEIAKIIGCKERKVHYWLDKHNIPKRTISDAIYIKKNPKGDPFRVKDTLTAEDRELFGLGLGLYWGEGTKSNKGTIRLGNTDPALIEKFIEFLVKIYGIKKKDLKFGLQIFSDMSPEKALQFWLKCLKVDRSQFQKIIVTQKREDGTYKNKIKHGVLTVHYNNKKLRNIIGKELEKYGTIN